MAGHSSLLRADYVNLSALPAIHAFPCLFQARTWMPGHRRAEATPSFGRLCPGMTEERCVVAQAIERALCLALGVEHCRTHGLGGRLAGPHHELQRRV